MIEELDDELMGDVFAPEGVLETMELWVEAPVFCFCCFQPRIEVEE